MPDKQDPTVEIGTTLYFVQEHLYYDKSIRTAPFIEYCVCLGEVTKFITGRYTELVIEGTGPQGFPSITYKKCSSIGKDVFYTAREAALLARAMTEKYERAWSWTQDTPLRRPWACLLEDRGESQ